MPSYMSLATPPAFNEKKWVGEHRLPTGYTGTKFNFRDVTARVKVESSLREAVILRKRVKIRFWHTGSEDGNHPLTFEIDGKHYDYALFFWSNRVVIEMTSSSSHKPASTMFPATIEELERALSSILDDAC